MEEQKSEYGKGFTYCLFLFAKHWWRHFDDLERNKKMKEEDSKLFSDEYALQMWFNGAGDHLFELEVPEKFKDTEIGNLTEELKKEGLEFRCEKKPTKEEFYNFFERIEKLMMLIDESLEVNPIKADHT